MLLHFTAYSLPTPFGGITSDELHVLTDAMYASGAVYARCWCYRMHRRGPCSLGAYSLQLFSYKSGKIHKGKAACMMTDLVYNQGMQWDRGGVYKFNSVWGQFCLWKQPSWLRPEWRLEDGGRGKEGVLQQIRGSEYTSVAAVKQTRGGVEEWSCRWG